MKTFLTFLLISAAFASQAAPRIVRADSIPVNPKDVATIDAIISALYQCVSGAAGEKRDWDRMRNLFGPGAHLISTGTKDGIVFKRDMMLEDYFTMAGPRLEKAGFFEIEIARKTEQYASIAQLFSTYESRHASSNVKPFARGINSIQLFNNGKRWSIVNIIWASESAETSIPEKYLK
jgi:hypothetical protein